MHEQKSNQKTNECEATFGSEEEIIKKP